MIEARFDTEALTRVRFAISPMWEVTRSAKALRDPAAAALHLPWVEQVLPRVADLDLAPLFALQSAPEYNPDFVNPPPSTPLVEFEDELQTMLETPDEQIAAEVRYGYEGAPIPAVLEPFLSEPRKAIEALAGLMREYWVRCHAENWPRMRSLLEHDVLYRSRQIADGGDGAPVLRSRRRRELARRGAQHPGELRRLARRGRARTVAAAERVRVAVGHDGHARALAADGHLPGTRRRDALEPR